MAEYTSQKNDEMLHHKIKLLKTLMLTMGFAIFIMGFVRYAQGALPHEIADFAFVLLLVFSLYKLHYNEQHFKLIARVVLFFAFALSIFLLINKHDADSRLVWFSTTLFVETKQNFNSSKEISAYDSELMQVFLNILKNAQDNFKEKGTKTPKISITTSDEDGHIKIEVCDNGGGIPAEIAEKIFDPYFSTKDEKNGSGLGLYMSKTIIEEHHQGKLYLENHNDGVCFIMELPC